MAQTLTQIKALLSEAGLQPKKRLGQNFLHDHNQMRRIVEAAELAGNDLVLEVGAGTGSLTEGLLEAGAWVIAVETDRDLEAILHRRLASFGERATLLMADVLEGKHRLNPVVERLLGDHPFKLVANLPYNVASPLLVNLASDHPRMQRAVVMVQREVAQRLLAPPGGKTYGPLGVMIQARCRLEQVAVLPPSCFWPAPRVSSAVVRLIRRDKPLTEDFPGLARLLHKLFSQRRKQIGSILGRNADLPAGVAPTARPETLSVEQLVALAGSSQPESP